VNHVRELCLKMTLPSRDAHGFTSDGDVRGFDSGDAHVRMARSGFAPGEGKTPRSHSPACQKPLAENDGSVRHHPPPCGRSHSPGSQQSFSRRIRKYKNKQW